MGWAIGFVGGRDVGYGVPCTCEYPACKKKIDRGLAYVCGDFPGSDEFGCSGYFCYKHLSYYKDDQGKGHQACDRCCHNYTLPEDFDYKTEWLPEYPRKPDIEEWQHWKLVHESWEEWRLEQPIGMLVDMWDTITAVGMHEHDWPEDESYTESTIKTTP
jgi:hypothetical protein